MSIALASPQAIGGNATTVDVERIEFFPGSDTIAIDYVYKDAGGNVLQRGHVAATGGITWWTNNHVAILNRLVAALNLVGATVT